MNGTKNTSVAGARMLANLLAAHGCRQVVLSPGSRNAPLAVAVSRHPLLDVRVVVDERTAAFMALGMASVTNRPVALVCTSGSAMLNYAPAVAEALYRAIPLVVVSADRPAAWIDQDDSQTIRQPGALDNIVLHSVDIPVQGASAHWGWQANRLINDALLACRGPRPGPVHINMQFDNPLGSETTQCNEPYEKRVITALRPPGRLTTAEGRALAASLQGKKVMFLCGFMPPDAKVSRALARLAGLPMCAVLTEANANVHGVPLAVSRLDTVLASLDAAGLQQLAPDVVITVGGALVSRMVKAWMRSLPGLVHWHVGTGVRGQSVDVFKCLEQRLEIAPGELLPALASGLQPWKDAPSTYASLWQQARGRAAGRAADILARTPWCDLTATQRVLELLPRDCNLQVSNGTPIRYVQLADTAHLHRVDCNRGVSGIEGSTSTAVGAALAYGRQTVLLTGDMSALYDCGALASGHIAPSLRIIVLDNAGGAIFRFIKSTRDLPELERCFVTPARLPVEKLAHTWGLRYLYANDPAALDRAMESLMRTSGGAAILHIDTSQADNAHWLREYLGHTNPFIP